VSDTFGGRKKERKNNNNNNTNVIRNGANTISLQTLFGDLIKRNGANTICLPNFVWGT
jgi:hypothetical protein